MTILTKGNVVKFRYKKLKRSKHCSNAGCYNEFYKGVPSLSSPQIRELVTAQELTIDRYDSSDDTYLVMPVHLWVKAKYLKRVT